MAEKPLKTPDKIAGIRIPLEVIVTNPDEVALRLKMGMIIDFEEGAELAPQTLATTWLSLQDDEQKD